MSKVLSTIGRIGKGFATIAGAVLGIGGFAFGGGANMDACLKTFMSQPANGAVAIGVLLAAFGLGRKAGWIAGGK